MTGEATTLVSIEASERKNIGKSYASKLRKMGKIPAVILEKGNSTLIELDPKLLPKAWRSPEKTFQLSLGGKKSVVKIKELQIHPVKRNALHVDLVYV